MAMEEAATRVNFALNSPDFWRGLGIALAILAGVAALRALLKVLRSPKQQTLVGTKWAQAAGIASWLFMAAAAVGYQWTRLGEPSYTWRLPVTLAGAVFGVMWAVGTIRTVRKNRKPSDT